MLSSCRKWERRWVSISGDPPLTFCPSLPWQCISYYSAHWHEVASVFCTWDNPVSQEISRESSYFKENVCSALRTPSTILAKGIYICNCPYRGPFVSWVTTPLPPFWLKKWQHHLVVINDLTQIICIRRRPFDKHLLNSYLEPGLAGALKNTGATQFVESIDWGSWQRQRGSYTWGTNYPVSSESLDFSVPGSLRLSREDSKPSLLQGGDAEETSCQLPHI